MSKDKKTAEPKRAVLYTRVSTQEQAERDLSLPAQLDALRAWARQEDYEILKEYVEPGESGRDDNRPKFRQMIGELLDGDVQANAVLVVHTSRFMRNTEASFVYRKKLEKRGIRVVSITQTVDDGPAGRLMAAIFAAFDQYESDMIGYRTAVAMRKNAERGFANGSKSPFGYLAMKLDEGKHTRRRLVVDPKEAPVLEEVFRLYVEGTGAMATAQALNRQGLRYRGGKPWHKDFVLRIIQEEAAVGTYFWGKIDNRTKQLRDRSEWVPIEVEPIIDYALFDLAQKIREERDPGRRLGKSCQSPLLLARMVSCGKCGAAYILETSGKGRVAGRYPHRYYNCRTYTRSGSSSCKGRRVKVDILERLVLDHLADKLFTTERCQQILETMGRDTDTLRKEASDERRALRREIAEVERRIGAWQAAFEEGTQDLDIVAPRLRELTSKKMELEAALAAVTVPEAPPRHLSSPETVRRFQSVIRDVFITADTAMTKTYLRFLVDRIVVTDEAIEIVAKTDAALGLMASVGAGEQPPRKPEEAVLTPVPSWLQLQDSNLRPGG